MSNIIIVSLISAGGSLIATLLGILNSILSRRMSDHLIDVGHKVQAVGGNIAQIATHTNSLTEALVKVTGTSEFAKGLKQGQEEKLNG